MPDSASLFSFGNRCDMCLYWWWDDGHWHSLVPRSYVGIEDAAVLTRCPLCQARARRQGIHDVCDVLLEESVPLDVLAPIRAFADSLTEGLLRA